MMRVKDILATLLLAVLPVFVSWAQEIRDIDIVVRVQQDGSAQVTQVWNVNINEGTEWYVPVSNLGKMDVRALSVSENGVLFESDGDDWDSDRSRRHKTGRSGIIRKRDGVELCWGIGDYGDHIWTVSFTLEGLVQNFSDYDGFNFQFVNPGMIAPPQHAMVTIVNETKGPVWTSENTKVWGFGLYGDINVKDGAIVEESSEPMGRNSSVIALVRFDKGMLSPSLVRDDLTFEELRAKAMDGSSYGEEDDPAEKFFMYLFISIFAGIGLMGLWMIVEIIRGRVYKESMFGTRKIDGWYRESPLGGNIPSVLYVIIHGKRFGSVSSLSDKIVGAYFLKWILNGIVKSVPDEKNAKRVNLVFSDQAPAFADEVETELYAMSLVASGENRILEAHELERWSRKHAKKVVDWPLKVTDAGKRNLLNASMLESASKARPEAQAELRKVIEFQKFLKDYTLIPERSTSDVGLWKDYLVFGQLFGMADKVAKQFQALYPAEFSQLETSLGTDLNRTILITNRISNNSYSRAYEKYTAGSAGGGGGRTSFGGGGGFSGGGFGGGAR